MSTVFLSTTEKFTPTDTARSYRQFAGASGSNPDSASIRALFATRGTAEWQASRTALVKSMARFVVQQSYKFACSSNIPQDDLMQEGLIGVLHAAESFDTSRGHRFITYAAIAARNAMLCLVAPRRKELQSTNLNIFDDAFFLNIPDGAPSLEDAYQSKRDIAAVRAGLARMSPENRTILLGRFGFSGEEVDFKELAAELGLADSRGAYARIAKALREFEACFKFGSPGH